MASKLFAALVLCLAVFGAEANNLKKGTPAYTMLVCDACKTVIGRLSKDVKYLIMSQKMWTDSVMDERLALSCSDPKLPTGAGADACAVFIADYAKLIKKEVALRWDEDSEEFEEDLVPKAFCTEKAFICKDDTKGINQMMKESEVRQKNLDEEKEDKAKRAKKKKR
eukprot:gb/GFBE01060055.1/.p1 GENE.gb/GFBE01060055.1/~~gb/GFBE01060055.1/.p1  ORF type:complete len:167 (+),score=58.36 gb/GFBE01060055.1/:1-501(+)